MASDINLPDASGDRALPLIISLPEMLAQQFQSEGFCLAGCQLNRRKAAQLMVCLAETDIGRCLQIQLDDLPPAWLP